MIGQIIGASNYDIGHLALGQPGGGVANLGVVGRSNKAGGCTGIPTPIGDFYADRLRGARDGPPVQREPPVQRQPAELLGRQPQRRHLGRAGLRLLDHGLRGHLPRPTTSSRTATRTSRSAASRRSRRTRRRTRRRSTRCRRSSLRHFGGGNEVQVVTFGPGFQQAATIQPLTVAIGAVPSATQLGGLDEVGNTVTSRPAPPAPRTRCSPATSSRSRASADAGYNGTFTVDRGPASRSFTYTNPTRACRGRAAARSRSTRPGATESGNTVTIRTAAAHGRSVGDIVDHRGRRRRRLQRHLDDHRGADAALVHSTRTRPPASPTPAAARRRSSRRSSPHRRQRLGRDRRLGPALHQRQRPDARSTRSPASPAPRPSPARPRPASPSRTAAPRRASTCRASSSST